YSSSDAFLPGNYAALYSEYFTNQSMQYEDNPIDKETIYQSRDDQGQLWDLELAENGYKVGTCPSQELVDAFETTDGQPILNLASPYADEKHTNPNYNTNNKVYDSNNPYENRDPRFYADIYFNGSQRKAYWKNADVKGNYARVIETYKKAPYLGIDTTNTLRQQTWTGYYNRKFLHPYCGDDYGVSAPCFKLFRFAEVYLNFAEAAAMTGKHDDEAIAAVNEVRKRVGMPEIPTGIEHSELILRIKNERRVELALEGHRFFDVRRWSKPNGDLSSTDKWVGAMEITKNADGTFSYLRRPVTPVERQCYTNKYLKLPLWYVEANLMESLTGERWQNPGW
ncbi:MAG: RagB/SusD family nutrient uptake outer membrane protein, partial [Bacteroidota bacterium]|nr:RagB/SusD family nutrient uptake outer membrane protein [Bacteroidota bacterium]